MRRGRFVDARRRARVPLVTVVLIGATATLVLGAGLARVAVRRHADRETIATLVLASADGLTLVPPAGDPIRILTTPVNGAYAIGRDLVAYQEAGDAPVKVWSAGGAVRTLPTGPNRPYVSLLDAAVVNGAPYALVSEHSRGTGPEDSFEEVVRIGVVDGARTTLVRRPSWETSYIQARLLPGGDFFGLISSLIYHDVVRVSPSAEDRIRWQEGVSVDADVNLLLRDRSPWVVTSVPNRDRARGPVLTIVRHDAASGHPRRSTTVQVAFPDGPVGSALSCRDWLTPSELACARIGALPIAVSVVDGSSRVLSGSPGAKPTAARPG